MSPNPERLAEAHRQIRTFVYLVGSGHHIAAWRHPLSPPGAAADFEHHRALAATAERGVLDAVFFADSLAINEESHHGILDRFDPVGLITALAAVTERIGLVATSSTSYDEPYNFARALATADRISGGRVGWNIVTTRDVTNSTAHNFGRDEHYEHSSRYERAHEFIEVVRGLWRSWSPDAFLGDKEAGVLFDPAGLHRLNHRGRFFSRVDGPLNIGPSPQGEPLLVQAGSSGPGIDLGGRFTNAAFTFQRSIPEAQAFRQSLRDKAAEYGRHPDEVFVLGGINPVIADSDEEAWAQIRELDALVQEDRVLAFLDDYFGGGIDFSGALGGDTVVSASGILELPEVRKDFWRTREAIRGREDELTLTELYSYLTGITHLDDFVGTPEKVADSLIRWFDARAFDGYILTPSLLPRDLTAFVDRVVPILQERGYSPSDYAHPTLRGRLGLID